MHGRVRACSRSTAQQTATTAVGLELGSDDGLDGTIGFDGEHSCASVSWRDRYATSRVGSRGVAARATASPVAIASAGPCREPGLHIEERSVGAPQGARSTTK